MFFNFSIQTQSNTTNALQIALDAVYKGAPSCHYQSDYGNTLFKCLGVQVGAKSKFE